ncbi:MAG: hypothetical protein MJ033_03775 [Victivallaceae bacterium]|nr:hypothetical protein [Victivallaceae bacterium]
MKKLIAFFCVLLLNLCGAEISFAERMEGVSPAVQKHLLAVLAEFPRTETGSFILKHLSPDVKFRTKAMAQLGTADNHDVITLEALRLDNQFFPETTERQNKIKICFTGEILAHELLHNCQFHAGLSTYPQNFSGYAGVLCERLIELQAKYTGEWMFVQLSELPEYRDFVAPKSGLFLVMQRQSKEPAKEYALTLWQNQISSSEKLQLARAQTREISQWNIYYAEQAFRNQYGRFLRDSGNVSDAEIAAQLEKIIRFTGMPLSGEELVKTSPVKPIPHGIALYENGKKVMELVAGQKSYVKRLFSGGAVREVNVPLNR